MKSHATYAGDPRNHATDLAELRAEVERIRQAPVVAMWSPCCGFLRAGDHWTPGSMHSSLCIIQRGGTLGPTIRLVPHHEDRAL